MPTAPMVDYDEAPPEVRAIYDEIMAVKGIDFVPNFWRTLASHPPLLAEVWHGLNRAMAPGRLDALTKEMVALAVSATNGCTYCIRSHTAAARKLGMDDEMLGELMAVVGTFNRTNRLADGYQVEVDPQIMAATEAGAATDPRAPETGERESGVARQVRGQRSAGSRASRVPRTGRPTSRRP